MTSWKPGLVPVVSTSRKHSGRSLYGLNGRKAFISATHISEIWCVAQCESLVKFGPLHPLWYYAPMRKSRFVRNSKIVTLALFRGWADGRVKKIDEEIDYLKSLNSSYREVSEIVSEVLNKTIWESDPDKDLSILSQVLIFAYGRIIPKWEDFKNVH